MADRNPPARAGAAKGTTRTLTDRVSARVAEAGLSLEQRDKASRGKRSRRSRAGTTLAPTGTPDEVRAARSLRRVFTEMGDAYHSYRRRTGQPVLVPLREAAYAFKSDPSLTSLVTVAGFLDDLSLLEW